MKLLKKNQKQPRQNKLSIVVLFCDKDYKCIEGLLKDIDRKVVCDHEVILVDNRDVHKNEIMPEIKNFLKMHEGEHIHNGKNLAQLASKRIALDKCNGNYVWFIDGDDELCDVVSPFLLDKCTSDIIAFNYRYVNESADETVYQGSFDDISTRKDYKSYRSADYLNKYGVTCWNKWYKVDILKRPFNNIPLDRAISCNEDVWVNSVALKYAKTITERPEFIYTNRPDRGVSNNRIKELSKFELLTQGYEETMKLFTKEFPKPCLLFDEQEKRTSDVAYFLNRIFYSSPKLFKKEVDIITNLFGSERILKVADNYKQYGFLSEYCCNTQDMETMIKELKEYLKER